MNCQSGQGKATATCRSAYPVLLSAIDPAAEDRLGGPERTVTSGRMLTEQDRPCLGLGPQETEAENRRDRRTRSRSCSAAAPLTAGSLSATVERLDVGDPAALPAKLGNPTADDLRQRPARHAVGTVTADLATGFPGRYRRRRLFEP